MRPDSCPGSSPRARGTRGLHHGARGGERFIPASAGNTAAAAASSPPAAVHPRERGEHAPNIVHHWDSLGSSPRARGTPERSPGAAGRMRFIPASAGNTSPMCRCWGSEPVHPRERGEHPADGIGLCATAGSSPRARGTRTAGRGSWLHSRFIPASAGNTTAPSPSPGLAAVHPRERGEHYSPISIAGLGGGSSPRARGTQLASGGRSLRVRFIPASAGNTPRTGRWPASSSVHPRERGEHPPLGRRHVARRGSSPRARGTPRIPTAHPVDRRFIPASAGNTNGARGTGSMSAVHPRERGEHPSMARMYDTDRGSSPRARGTRRGRPPVHRGWRFIPASAGNTNLVAAISAVTPVHPRERGEHKVKEGEVTADLGSSPRARGTRRPQDCTAGQHRFIPASAGNTCPPHEPWRARPVHPRERGEHAWMVVTTTPLPGSSPRARG